MYFHCRRAWKLDLDRRRQLSQEGKGEGLSTQLSPTREAEYRGSLAWARWRSLQDLPRMVSNRLRSNAPPALVIIHLGSNNIGQHNACECRMEIDAAIQDIRLRVPHTPVIWSNILPRLLYYGRKQGPSSQQA